MSQRKIAGATGCSVGTVCNVLSNVKASGIGYLPEVSTKELGSLLYPPRATVMGKPKPEPDLGYLHREMQKKGMTLTLLWEEYKSHILTG